MQREGGSELYAQLNEHNSVYLLKRRILLIQLLKLFGNYKLRHKIYNSP
jgi:hypothetical protein